MLTVMFAMCECVILGMAEFCLSHLYYCYFVGPNEYAMIPFPSYYFSAYLWSRGITVLGFHPINVMFWCVVK